MKILIADTIITMDPARPIVRNGAVVFDENIIEVTDDAKVIERWKSKAEVIEGGEHSVVLPGLMNPHVHLEFSAHTTQLDYGNFIGWLYTVMEKRESLIGGCDQTCHETVLADMLRGGVTTVGAVSSYGFDLPACAAAKQRIVYFNELIGSNPAAADVIFAGFVDRLERSKEFDSERFRAGIAIHSPYSVHPALVRKAVSLARTRRLPLSAHFMESKSERRWLDNSTGEFKPFFEKFLKTSSPVTDAAEFLGTFEGVKTLFVHCVQATNEELDKISKMGGAIIHCPVSNRLLGCGLLGLEKVKNREIPYMVATDGLSSNHSLSLFGELRSALMMHEGLDLPLLARDLLRSVTEVAATQLGVNAGRLAPERAADMLVFRLPDTVADTAMLYVQAILHAPEQMDDVFVNGERIVWND